MNLLVLGGAGYVGSQFVWQALDAGHKISVVDTFERGHIDFLPKDIDIRTCDVRDSKQLVSIIQHFNPEIILHYAAYALVPESVVDPLKYYDNNVGGVIALLRAIEIAGSRCPLVFSSTCAVFGTPKLLPIGEEDPQAPESPYGTSKQMCEQVLRDVCPTLGISALALRYFNACGGDPKARCGEAHEPETHIIPNIIKAIQNNSSFNLYGRDFPTRDGTCIRDYIHVADLADAHLRAAEYLLKRKEPIVEAVHLGTGNGFSNLEVVRAVELAANRKVKLEFKDRRPGDPAELYANPRKARELLGFVPRHSDLNNIAETAWKWAQKHANR